MRRPIRWGGALLLLACATASPAHSEGDADTARYAPKGAAFLNEVAQVGEEKAYDALARSGDDPWIVAEDLLLLGKPDAARRLATAGLGRDDSPLRAYVESPPEPDRELAARVVAAEALLAEKKPQEALDAVGSGNPALGSVTAIRALEVRAAALEALGKSDEAAQVDDRLAVRLEIVGWHRAEIAVRMAMLDRLDPDAHAGQAIRILNRLITLDDDAQDLARSAGWCVRLGRLYASRESWRLARSALFEGEALFDAQGQALAPALVEQRLIGEAVLADAHLALGEVAAAFKTADAAYRAAKTSTPAARLEAARALGSVYVNLFRLTDGESLFREAADLARTAAPGRRPLLLGDLARVLVNEGKFDEAEPLYAQVLNSESVKQSLERTFVGRIHLAMFRLDRPAEVRGRKDVEAALLELLNILHDMGALPPETTFRAKVEVSAHAIEGRAYNLLGRPSEAIAPLRQVLEDPYGRQFPSYLEYAGREMCRALRASGRPAEALAQARHALDLVRDRVAPLSGSLALSSLASPTVADLVSEDLAAAVETKDPKEIRQSLEETRGISFLAEVGRRRRAGGPAGGTESSADVARLASEVAHAANLYWQASSAGNLVEVRAKREEFWNSRVRLRTAREHEDMAGGPPLEPSAPSLLGPDVREEPALEPDEAMLYLGEAAGKYVVVLAFRDRLTWEVRTPVAETMAQVQGALSTWLDSSGDAEGPARTALLQAVLPEAVRRALTSPSADDQAPPAHVYVAPGGPLPPLPWPALLASLKPPAADGSPGGPTVSIVACQGVLRYLKDWNTPARSGPIVAVGDPDYTSGGANPAQMAFFGKALGPLPATGDEVRAITDPSRKDLVRTADQATTEFVRAALEDAPYPFEVLHLACHGVLYGQAPWMSALALHATSGDDGLITVGDVGQMHLERGPHLVVLAACESGVGSPVPGEGEEGLVRAFLVAGARHVVASLWDIPDRASSDLMIAFHRLRRERHLTPVVALAEAQRAVRAANPSRFATPRTWAGWAVWGPRD
jgi:tetratricopeptide (TPR) repeat protein